MAKTSIEWATDVWNPVTGCSKVSQGCKNCYAETMAKRFWGDRPFTEVRLHPERLGDPLNWKKPRRIFVNSMSDLFHPNVPFDFMLGVISMTTRAPQHTYIILTKRPGRMIDFFEWLGLGVLPQNIWLGVSVENQETANERIPLLLQTPAAVRFLSCEPLLGPVDIRDALNGYPEQVSSGYSVTREMAMDAGEPSLEGMQYGGNEWVQTIPPVDWVIVGGESGPGARPMYPDWARQIRNDCQTAGVPFLFKQWGNNLPSDQWAGESLPNPCSILHYGLEPISFYGVGKTRAGRLLDGIEWNQYPQELEK